VSILNGERLSPGAVSTLPENGLSLNSAPFESPLLLERANAGVCRYVPLQKTHSYVAAKYNFPKPVKRRLKKRDRFSRRAD